MIETLAEGLKPACVNFEVLHKQYNPLLALVRELIGIIPNCDPILEIWPAGFRTYNLLVPNMFNLPGSLLGSRSFKASMGLAMYASSKASCAYCTAHACSFALRRGATNDAISGQRTPKEQAVVAFAERLSAIPSQLTLADVEAVNKHFSQPETEWLVFSISMMGFLNKFMNAIGVELEQDAINDTAALLSQTGWQAGIHALNGYRITKNPTPKKDDLFTYLRVVRHAPGAILWEKQWVKGVPSHYEKSAEYLVQHTGYNFPLLMPVKQPRVIRTLTAALRDNLNKNQTQTGLKINVFAAVIFSEQALSNSLTAEIKSMAGHLTPELNDDIYDSLRGVARTEIPADGIACKALLADMQRQFLITETEAALMLLAIGASHCPALMNDVVIETVFEAGESGRNCRNGGMAVCSAIVKQAKQLLCCSTEPWRLH